jgi:hypothetical protein
LKKKMLKAVSDIIFKIRFNKSFCLWPFFFEYKKN